MSNNFLPVTSWPWLCVCDMCLNFWQYINTMDVNWILFLILLMPIHTFHLPFNASVSTLWIHILPFMLGDIYMDTCALQNMIQQQEELFFNLGTSVFDIFRNDIVY